MSMPFSMPASPSISRQPVEPVTVSFASPLSGVSTMYLAGIKADRSEVLVFVDARNIAGVVPLGGGGPEPFFLRTGLAHDSHGRSNHPLALLLTQRPRHNFPGLTATP